MYLKNVNINQSQEELYTLRVDSIKLENSEAKETTLTYEYKHGW